MNVNARIISLEELLILKIMTKGREKDVTDVVSLIMDKGRQVDVEKLACHCKRTGLKEHMTKRLNDFIVSVKNGEVKKVWESLTGKRIAWKVEQDTVKFMKRILQSMQG
jgi:hypothetical protein